MAHNVSRTTLVETSGGQRLFTASCSCGRTFQDPAEETLAGSVAVHLEPRQSTERNEGKGRQPRNGSEA